jgi:hypothetical protein
VSSSAPQSKPRQRWPAVVILVLIVLFILVLAERRRILAHWWVWRLHATTSLAERSYYVTCLVSVGDAADGALGQLAADDRVDFRSLAIPASQGLSMTRRSLLLQRCMSDSDCDIRVSAATALAFTNSASALRLLMATAGSDKPDAVTAAVAGLARVDSTEAIDALCNAVHHPNPWVRAQAVESFGQQIVTIPPHSSTSRPSVEATSCDPLEALVGALVDHATFTGCLALERQIEAAASAVMVKKGVRVASPTNLSAETQRTVDQIAATTLRELTGHAVEPRDTLSPQEKEALVQQCRQWMTGRRP